MAAEEPSRSGRISSEANPFTRVAEAARRAREGTVTRPQTKLSGESKPAAQKTDAESDTKYPHTEDSQSARRHSQIPSPLTVFGKSAPRPDSGIRVYASSGSIKPAPLASTVFREKLADFTAETRITKDERQEENAAAEGPRRNAPTAKKIGHEGHARSKPTTAIFARPRIVGDQIPGEHAVQSRSTFHEQPSDPTNFAAIAARMAQAAQKKRSTGNAEAEREEAEPEENALRIHPQQVREIQEGFAERSRPVVLIGPMAAGKTYIGTHLARFYGYEFVDADHLIVERYGEVSEIFEIFGEAYFRELELKTIEEVLTSPTYRNTVFSLGGGAPMTDAVAELLHDECVIYILVDVDTVEPRITGNKTRPLLEPNPVERWSEIFERRKHRYEELAQHILDARGEKNISLMTAEIQNFVLAFRKEHSHD